MSNEVDISIDGGKQAHKLCLESRLIGWPEVQCAFAV